MSDEISGVRINGPSYPVKPVPPVRKDRESGKEERDPPSSEPEPESEDKADDKPTIDEYI